MKTMRIISILILALTVLSCNKNRIYKAETSFPDYRWEKSNILEFTPEILDKDCDYKLSLAFRHVAGFQLKEVLVNVEITAPSGEKSVRDYKLSVYNDQNEVLSECAGDYCDLETVIENNFKFTETGKYQFKISHTMEIDPIPNAMDLGLIIDKVEQPQ